MDSRLRGPPWTGGPWACRQWRSLNVDHDWLAGELEDLPAALGMRVALDHVRVELPEVKHGNFTRPAPVLPVAANG